MADYDWKKQCGCDLVSPHREFCPDNPRFDFNVKNAVLRTKGFTWSENSAAYYCRRGCGTLVWDVDAHMKNVCTEFNPIAG